MLYNLSSITVQILQCSIQMFCKFSVRFACLGNPPGNFACVLLLLWRLCQSCHRFLLKRGAISKCVRKSRPFSYFLSFYLHLNSQQFSLFIFSPPFFVCLFVFPCFFVGLSFYFFVCDLFVCCLLVI